MQPGVAVRSPVKVHLNDGSTVVFANGITISDGELRGAGIRYGLSLGPGTPVASVPLSEVAAAESFQSRESVDAGLTALTTVGMLVAVPVLAVAIFGSCPTVYSGPEGVLEAETFSYSIAPLFEARDLDRLVAQPDADGWLQLEVRNEALETHYINHLVLQEVVHGPGERALPDQHGRPVIVAGERAPSALSDRGGRDVREALAQSDGVSYRTPPAVLDAAADPDMQDWIDLEAEAPAGTSELALVFRLRNSLLNTVLFYEVMLAGAGPRALDWLGGDLERISNAVELGRWVRQRLGLRVLLWQDGAYRELARVPDAGPIAWRDVAAVVPVPAGERRLRLRLSFVADAWRIDRLAVASSVHSAEPRLVPLAEVRGAGGALDADAAASLADADGRYLQTRPGQSFLARFAPGPARGRERAFLLSSQGYYTEWIRGDWLRGEPGRFQPSDQALGAALAKWRRSQAWYEREFERRRVPTS